MEFKVHTNAAANLPTAAFVHVEDAAAFIGVLDSSESVIRYGGKIVWSEGAEKFCAAESYDGVAEIVHNRINRSKK